MAQATSPTKTSTVLRPEPLQRLRSLRPIRPVATKEEATTPPIQPPTAPGGADQTTATARREWRPERRNSHGSGKASYNLGSQGLRGAHQGKQGGYPAQRNCNSQVQPESQLPSQLLAAIMENTAQRQITA